jgi:N-acetyl-gamma-glutamyl-phosphate reductase
VIAGIIGAAGYAGSELIRVLLGHRKITGLVLASVSKPGENIATLYPNFLGTGDSSGNSAFAKFGNNGAVLVAPEQCISASDIVFGALPAGAGESYVKLCLERGISYIDLSADFRFADCETYSKWYGKHWQYPELHLHSVYGLPELNRSAIKELAAKGPCIIGNPGCYPTAISLACYPAFFQSPKAAGNNCIRPGAGTVIADAISGVSGTGRDSTRTNHFCECSDAVSAYKVGSHRHTPEISSIVSKIAGRSVPLVFTPHLGPLNRGILATVYVPLETAVTEKAARDFYTSFYKDEPFVRVLPENIYAATNRVRQSNYCDMSVHLDHTGTVLIVVSAIDNMVKGAAGQAVQNMNIVSGFNETEGLAAVPALF